MNKSLEKVYFLFFKIFSGYSDKFKKKEEVAVDDGEFFESTTKNNLVKEYIKSYETNLKRYLKEKMPRENKQ